MRRMLSTTTSSKPAVDVLVVGGGAVGLAVARAMGLRGREVFLVERERQFGQGVSSRSSEVVHAGIYYPHRSRKAEWCVQGRRMLRVFCQSRGVPFRECGKLLVAAHAGQEAALDRVAAHAAQNGVGDLPDEALVRLSREQARELEPEVECHAALLSPATAVVDSHAYMAAVEAEAAENGVNIVYGTTFESASRNAQGAFEVKIQSEAGETDTVTCATIINCAGLSAPLVARAIKTGVPLHDDKMPRPHYCKGNYFKLEGVTSPFTRLIYPLPEAHGLGVHLTIDMNGAARFGPDVEWIDGLDKNSYVVDPKRADSFYAAIRTYWPGLPDSCLVPDYAGIRPKLGPANQPAVDFQVWDHKVHGVQGLVHCLGIESPGLTSSLALAEYVSKIV